MKYSIDKTVVVFSIDDSQILLTFHVTDFKQLDRVIMYIKEHSYEENRIEICDNNYVE